MEKAIFIVFLVIIGGGIISMVKHCHYRENLEKGKVPYHLPLMWRLCGWSLLQDIKNCDTDNDQPKLQHKSFQDPFKGTVDVYKLYS